MAETTETESNAEEKLEFQTEVARLLQIVANSLYSETEIFLRELISNASDACDRLRYEALTTPALTSDDPEFRVEITIDAKAKTLTVADNGIGMNRDDLVRDLGTIARSGTSAYLDNLTGDAAKDVQLIGQFGVGFYSAFMVAEQVEVVSRRAGEDAAWRWESDGLGTYTVSEGERDARGTTITMHIRKDQKEFLEPDRIRQIVKTYSDHTALPVVLKGAGEAEDETLNAASALWTRAKKDITEDQYREFYHHVSHAFDDPWMTLHWRAEGKLEYTNLLFIPGSKPFDLFNPDRKSHLKLYVKRVFITDEAAELVPPWLRFVRGVVDTEDLPLNVSRELLQNNPLLARLRSAIVRRVLGDLAKKAEKAPEEYTVFWENFGAVLKEGLYEDADNRDKLLELVRFNSTAGDEVTSFADYVARMKENQTAIYYISADEIETARRSPQLEGFAARGIEVLILTDAVDEFWLQAVPEFDGKPFKSVTRGTEDLDAISPDTEDAAEKADDPADAGKADTVIALLKLALGEAVKDVRPSKRLTDSAVCLVADDGDLDMRLERMLKQHNQLDAAFPRILEINPSHPLIRGLADAAGNAEHKDALDDIAWLLLDQARIIEGDPVPDPGAFARRMSDALARGLIPAS